MNTSEKKFTFAKDSWTNVQQSKWSVIGWLITLDTGFLGIIRQLIKSKDLFWLTLSCCGLIIANVGFSFLYARQHHVGKVLWHSGLKKYKALKDKNFDPWHGCGWGTMRLFLSISSATSITTLFYTVGFFPHAPQTVWSNLLYCFLFCVLLWFCGLSWIGSRKLKKIPQNDF